MIAASRKASYIATMGNAWASYTKTGDYVTFYNEMQTFLTQQYRYDDKFRNTIVTLVDDPAAPIYTSNTSYTSIRKYQQHVRDEVLVRSEALGTGIGFFAADGSLYMMRNLLDANYRTYGVLVMELNTDTLFDSMRSVIWMTDATVCLGDLFLLWPLKKKFFALRSGWATRSIPLRAACGMRESCAGTSVRAARAARPRRAATPSGAVKA